MTSPAPSDDGWVGEGFFFPFLFRPLYYTVAVGPFIIRYSFEPREVRHRRRSLSLSLGVSIRKCRLLLSTFPLTGNILL